MIKQTFSAALFCVVAGCTPSAEKLGGKSSSMISSGDNDFYVTVAQSDKTEMDSSKMALSMSSNSQVKEFANMMITDHQQADAKVMAVATEKGVTLPTMLDSTHQAIVDAGNGKMGTDFDKTYIEGQITAHKDTIKTVEDEANNGTDPQTKALAAELLPTLKMHLQHAEMIKSSM